MRRFCLAASFLLLTACGAGAVTVVQSSDGVLSLAIDASALQDDVSVSDISVEQKSDSQYSLLPHGLIFTKPVTVTYVAQDGKPVTPFVMHRGGGGLELVDTKTSIEPEGTKVTFEINHFSDIIFGGGSACNIDFSVSRTELPPGESFTMRSTLTRGEGRDIRVVDPKYDMKEYEITYHNVRPPNVSGNSWTQGRILGPSRVSDLPGTRPMPELTTTVDQEFTCSRRGGARVFHVYILNFFARITEHNIDKNGTRLGQPTVRDDNVVCEIYKGEDIQCVPVATSSSAASSASSDPNKNQVVCLVIDGERYPQMQFFRVDNHCGTCGEEHWHSNFPVASLEGSVREDPDPPGCGYGKTYEIPLVHCILDKETFDRFTRAGQRGQ